MEYSKAANFDSIFEFDSDLLKNTNHRLNTRISLAYAQLDEIPTAVISQLANHIQFLDLSHNLFRNLKFLNDFTNLRTLILDRNLTLDCKTLPFLQNLEVLWLNNCNLINIEDWLRILQVQCPNLRHLSMMCNPVGRTQLNGVTDSDENAYRKQVIAILPQLKYFDGIPINASEYHPTLALALLEDTFDTQLRHLRNLYIRIHTNFKSMDKLNASQLLRTMKLFAKNS